MKHHNLLTFVAELRNSGSDGDNNNTAATSDSSGQHAHTDGLVPMEEEETATTTLSGDGVNESGAQLPGTWSPMTRRDEVTSPTITHIWFCISVQHAGLQQSAIKSAAAMHYFSA